MKFCPAGRIGWKEDYLPLHTVRLLLVSTTVLEGLFEEYHCSLAALGKQRLGVTKQPPFGDWGSSSNTRTSLMFIMWLHSNAEERSQSFLRTCKCIWPSRNERGGNLICTVLEGTWNLLAQYIDISFCCIPVYTVCNNITLSEVLNPIEWTQDHSARNIGLLILEECDGSKYWDVTTSFYAFSDIPKSLEILIL